METVDTDSVGPVALETETEPAAEQAGPFESTPSSRAARERERALSIAIGQALRDFYRVLVDFEPAFELLLGVGRRLAAGELKLRTVVDVGGDFEAAGEEAPAASEDRTGAAVKRVAGSFRRLAALRRGYLRLKTRARIAQRREELVDALEQLSIHPRQLRELVEEVKRQPKGHQRGARELARAHRRLEAAKAEMMRAHLYLVAPMARRYAGHGLDYTDLFQEGAVGLMRAVERFDHRRGLRFGTYAHWWIRQAFTRALADHSRTVRLPVNVNEHLFRMRQVSAELGQKLGREPTLEELADAVGLSVEKATRLLESQRPAVSLDEPVDDEGDVTLLDRVADSSTEDPTANTDRTELEQLLERALAQLSPNEQRVLRLRFGVGGREGSTLEEIGGRLGVSRERVRQIESRALKTLQRRGHELSLDAYRAAS